MKKQESIKGAVGRRITVGLFVDEGVATDIVKGFVNELPSHLEQTLSDGIIWKVEYRPALFSLDEESRIHMDDIAKERRRSKWDVAVLVTDLPRRAGTQPIVSDYSVKLGVALLSLPALGARRLHRRSRDLVVHLLGHLLENKLSFKGGHSDTVQHLGAVQHIQTKDTHADEHLALKGVRGRVQLLAGMVLDNRPWRLVPHLASATAAAAATAAYGIITNSFWSVAVALPSWRLGLINVLAIGAMVMWLLFYNYLWEKPTQKSEREKAFLYNMSTVITLTIGVTCMYIVLYVVALVAAIVVIDGNFFGKQTGVAGNFGSYATIVWLASSVGIVAGALGSSFESKEAVLKATYGKREQERQRTPDNTNTST